MLSRAQNGRAGRGALAAGTFRPCVEMPRPGRGLGALHAVHRVRIQDTRKHLKMYPPERARPRVCLEWASKTRYSGIALLPGSSSTGCCGALIGGVGHSLWHQRAAAGSFCDHLCNHLPSYARGYDHGSSQKVPAMMTRKARRLLAIASPSAMPADARVHGDLFRRKTEDVTLQWERT